MTIESIAYVDGRNDVRGPYVSRERRVQPRELGYYALAAHQSHPCFNGMDMGVTVHRGGAVRSNDGLRRDHTTITFNHLGGYNELA